ncbi:MAG TPA: 6,7-dimethyl-8-ribityllumazine synthase, partial [Gemmatimonadaceae bacterium]
MAEFSGEPSGRGRRYGIVAARFNDFIVKALLEGALDAVRRHGGEAESVDVVWVPGSYEIPLAAREMAKTGRYDALVCLGAVIRGSTAHFDYVAGGASNGISSVALETGVPTIFGVITTETIEQAIERADVAGHHVRAGPGEREHPGTGEARPGQVAAPQQDVDDGRPRGGPVPRGAPGEESGGEHREEQQRGRHLATGHAGDPQDERDGHDRA